MRRISDDAPPTKPPAENFLMMFRCFFHTIFSSPTARLAAWMLAAALFSSRFACAANAHQNLAAQHLALDQVGQALSGVVRKARDVNAQLGYGFGAGGSVFGTRLRPGSAAHQTFSLQAGQRFVFIGGGDKTARNLDLVLRDAAGRVVSQDIEADAAPFLLVRPQVSGRYTLTLALKSGWNGSAFCALTVLRKGGTRVPPERIVEAAIRLDSAVFTAFGAAQGGRLTETPGGWSLFGGLAPQGAALLTAPQRFGKANGRFLAVGDSRIRDLDIALLDGSGKVLASDSKNGVAPRLTSVTKPGIYGLRVTNRRSLGPAIIMAVCLDLPTRADPRAVPAASAQPTPATSTASPASQHSPFEGTWKGDFGAATGHQGSLRIEVEADGDFVGHFSEPTLGLAAKLKGAVFANGAFAWQYTQKKQDGWAEGTFKWSDATHQKIEGSAVFSSRGVELGSDVFTLEKQK